MYIAHVHCTCTCRWALQQREDLTEETPETERWQLTELAVRASMPTY